VPFITSCFEIRKSKLGGRISSFEFRVSKSALALLVLGILANHQHHAAALHNLALRANLSN
jgi:hypothetical protein